MRQCIHIASFTMDDSPPCHIYIYTARLAAERAEVEAEEHHGGGDERPHVLVLVGKVLGDQRHQAHAEEGVGHRVHHLLGERLYIYDV